MLGKVRNLNLFAKSFTFGLLLLFADVLRKTFPAVLKTDSFNIDAIPFFAVGVTVCLISLLFLLTEWVMLPYGTQAKRIKLYQGAGNLFAFAILVFGCLSENSLQQYSVKAASLTLSSGGFVVTIVFGWMGKRIADYCSRKKIKPETFVTRNQLPLAETVK